MANDWLIYGKERDKKRFMAFTGEGFTSNLIHAIRFPPDQWVKAQDLVDQLNRDNPRYVFQVRRGKGSIYPEQRPRKDMVCPGGSLEYYDSPHPTSEGDLIIRGRQKGLGTFRPFDGTGFDGEPLRWPSAFRQEAMSIARSLEMNNPELEFEVARMPDTVFKAYPTPTFGDPLRRKHLHDARVAVPYFHAFERPELPRDVRLLESFPDVPFQPATDYPMDYSTQLFGTEIVTEPLKGSRTPAAKCRSIDNAIAAVTLRQANVIKSTLKNGTYYGVVEACNRDLGSCQHILLTGRVLDCDNGAVSTFLLQSDTGSSFLDVPKSYLDMIDAPRTEADRKYRTMVAERLAGDGRAWGKRRYTVDGTEMDAGQMVSRFAKLTGRTPWEVETSRGIRALRVHDSYEEKGSKIVRCFNLRRRRRRDGQNSIALIGSGRELDRMACIRPWMRQDREEADLKWQRRTTGRG